MKPIEYYRHKKELLTAQGKEVKKANPKDKAYCRQVINDNLDGYIRELDINRLREEISEKQYKLYCKWLESLACRLHP